MRLFSRELRVGVFFAGCVLGLASAGSAQVYVDEQFNYPDGPLNGNGAWTGSAGAEITVESQAIKIQSTLSATIVEAALPVTAPACESGVLTVTMRIRGDAAGDNSTLWGVHIDDTNGKNLARFFRGCRSVAGRTNGLSIGYLTDTNPVSTASFDEVKAVINTITHQTTYYINGVLMAVNPPNFVNPVSHGVDGHLQQTVVPTIGRIRVERQATATATGFMTIDDIKIVGCEGTCSAQVTPTAGQVAYAQAGQPADPPSFTYTFTNNNQDAISYTVAEVDAAGAAQDHPWLSLDKSSGGPLTNAQSDNVVASLNTTGLTAGVYVGYIKFTDSCAPGATYIRSIKLLVEDCLTDNFNYPNRPLDTVAGWAGPPVGVANPLRIENNTLRLDGGGWGPLGATNVNLTLTHAIPATCPGCPVQGGLISVKLKVKGGTGTSNIWRLFISDASGLQIASWAGTGTTVRGRVDNGVAGSIVTDTLPISTTSFDELEARINTNDISTLGVVPPNSTLFLINGVPVTTTGSEPPVPHVNPIQHHLTGAGNAVGQVQMVRLVNIGAVGEFVFFDDLTVQRCAETCNDPVFDVRDTSNASVQDNKVTVHDFNIFAGCATRATPDPSVFDALAFECRCMDVNGDQAVDIQDFGVFQLCYTGPAGTVSTSCDD